MKSSRKFMAALAAASLVSGLSIAPAFADDHGHDQRGHSERGRDWHPDHRGPYAYAQPVYVPPTVYIQPQQSPGISLFLPLEFRR